MEWVSEDFDHRFTAEGDEVVVTGRGDDKTSEEE
jgi:hypothetical protein